MTINKKLFAAILIAAGFIWILASRVQSSYPASNQFSAPHQGFSAPNFSLTTLNGDQITLSDLRGKAVILNYWASWCPPCRAEMPAFQQAYSETKGESIVYLAVNATNQDSLPDVKDFANQYQLEFPILLDQDGSVGRLYQIHSLPTTFFIDSSGIIQEVVIGGPIPISLLRIKSALILEASSYVPSD